MTREVGGVPPVEAVNFHVWQPCNMRCAFCFDRFLDVRRSVLPRGHLSRPDALAVIEALGAAGFQKITFAGGEPLLCPWLPELVATASRLGMTTALVTNGSLLHQEALDGLRGALDWLVLSLDSDRDEVLRATGRATAGRPLTRAQYLSLCRRARDAGIRLKINTVVHRRNWADDMTAFIAAARPDRWKLMQVLRIEGQNDGSVGPLLIAEEQFTAYVERHRRVERLGVVLVAEANPDMIGSYAMVDPAGRFFDNVRGRYRYSSPILASGVQAAIDQVSISRRRFLARGGRYPWTLDRAAATG